MLLKQITLHNIRSYIHETISLPPGTTLLSGDIGSGKSTILLAVEFALFGTSRPDLPAEFLLRNGTNHGSVELTLELDTIPIIIQRSLKRDKTSIKQLPGYIIINNLKKELMPIELKAEVLTLLGYPEEYLTKNKNYIFRYTVYTPQEEMKLILQEDSDLRLDVLRKIFNVDKYKTVRENLLIYLKQMRVTIAHLSTLIEPLPQLQEQHHTLEQEMSAMQNSLHTLSPTILTLQQQIQSLTHELSLLEEQQRKEQHLQAEQRTINALLLQKENNIQHLQETISRIHLELSQVSFLTSLTIHQLQEKLAQLQEQQKSFLTTKTTIQEQLRQLQNLIKEQNSFITKTQEQLAQLPEKQYLLVQLEKDIATKSTLQEKKRQLEDLWEKTITIITKNQTLLQQSQEVMNTISQLENCPTCLQPVSEEHKQRIINQEQERSHQAENLLFEFHKKRVQIMQQREEASTSLDNISTKETLFAKTKAETAQLMEKKEIVQEKQQHTTILIQENNVLMTHFQRLGAEEQQSRIAEQSKEIQHTLEFLSRKDILERQRQEQLLHIDREKNEIKNLQNHLREVQQALSQQKDITPTINTTRSSLQQVQVQERGLAVQIAEFKTHLQNKEKLHKDIKQKKQELTIHQNTLLRTRELYNWLEEHFLNLTITIEKHVMVTIHHHFNQLFQEWFSLLIDEENVSSRIDDTFTPIIEQNGYDVSFQHLSGGEKTAASLAYRLALNRVINDIISQIKTKDLLILDEPTDGFSAEQLDKVRDVLDRLNIKQTIIVSHESKIESFVNNVVRIGKESHVSSIMN